MKLAKLTGGPQAGARPPQPTDRTCYAPPVALAANDGIVSTASLIVGVAAADAARGNIMIAGVAGLVAGAMSMAAGEYVSVSSQADIENADLERERTELLADREGELSELAGLYVHRGLDESLAHQVAAQLMEHDALGAHARDELGISEVTAAWPIQAALASAATFVVGAGMPLGTAFLVPPGSIVSDNGHSCTGGLDDMHKHSAVPSVFRVAAVCCVGALCLVALPADVLGCPGLTDHLVKPDS